MSDSIDSVPDIPWRIRSSTSDDLFDLLALYDEAVVWLNAQGITGQRGSTPVSERAHLVEEVRESLLRGFVAENGAIMGFAEVELGTPDGIASLLADGEVADGAYVHSLVGSRSINGRGAGAALLDYAARYARDNGKTILRLNLRAGNPRLMAYYKSQGFTCRSAIGQNDGILMERKLI